VVDGVVTCSLLYHDRRELVTYATVLVPAAEVVIVVVGNEQR
jgi:hypothetical protein